MPKLMEREVVLIKQEDTYGVDSHPTAADAIPVLEAIKPEYDVKLIERKHPLYSVGKYKPLVGARFTKTSLKVECSGSGTVDLPPKIGVLLEGCGFAKTINKGESVVYSPGLGTSLSNTMYMYIDGLLYKILGAVGSCKLSAKAGEACNLECEYQGLYQEDADAPLVTPVFDPHFAHPPLALGCRFSLEGITTFILREFSIDMAIAILARESMTAPRGYAGFLCGRRDPVGTLVLEAESKAAYDFLGKWEQEEEVEAELTMGSKPGNRFTIRIPHLSYTNITLDNQDGLCVMNIPISINQGTEASDMQIIFD